AGAAAGPRVEVALHAHHRMGKVDRHAIGLGIGLDQAGIAGRLTLRRKRALRLGIAGRAPVGLQLADDHAVLVDDGLALVAALAGNLARLFLGSGLLFLGGLEQILF